MAKWESLRWGNSAPDRLNIPRKSFGVIALCRLVDGSALVYAARSARTTGRRLGECGMWKGLCLKWPRNVAPKLPAACRTVFATTGCVRIPSGSPVVRHLNVRKAWRKVFAKRLCSSKDRAVRKGSPVNPTAPWNPTHLLHVRSLSSLLLSCLPRVMIPLFAALPRANS